MRFQLCYEPKSGEETVVWRKWTFSSGPIVDVTIKVCFRFGIPVHEEPVKI